MPGNEEEDYTDERVLGERKGGREDGRDRLVGQITVGGRERYTNKRLIEGGKEERARFEGHWY